MGKAFVYDGFKVSNPIKKVVFEKGVIDEPVREYLSKLSVVPSDKQISAIQNFYKKLSESGIWETIAFCYPMFGSVEDCGIGLKGDKLRIPNGAIYDNGLNLEFATDGVSISKKGILIKEFPSEMYTKDITLYYNSDYSSYGGDVYCFTNAIGDSGSSDGCLFGPSYSKKVVRCDGLGTEDLFQTLAKGVACYATSYTRGIANTYMNGGNKKECQKKGIAHSKYLGINTWGANMESHQLNRPINFLVGSYTFHTEEQVNVLSEEITKLKEVLFER